MKKTFIVILLLLTTVITAFSQNTKQGGVCFRFDDNHKPYHWHELMKVFAKHNKPFSASLNAGTMDEKLKKIVIDLQKAGHEVLDHTPFHSLTKLKIAPWKTAKDYQNHPGVDHINGNLVCLRYKTPNVKPQKLKDAIIKGKQLKLQAEQNSRFSRFAKARDLTVYFPSLEKAFRAFYVPDSAPSTFNLKTIWNEDTINFDQELAVQCYFMRPWVFRIAPEAHELLAQESLDYFKQFGAKRPYTWIMPGGGLASTDADEIKKIYGDKFGYKSSACWGKKSTKVFNEPNDSGIRPFGMTWGDFNDEAKSLEWNKTQIADRVALHHVVFGRSHLSSRIGGWKGYMKRLDDLLKWCNETGIPVHTQAKWAEILYNTPQKTTTNIFPDLSLDRDKNNRPDGYSLQNAVYKTTPEAYLEIPKNGPAFQILRLGGLEKGKNKLSFQLKGTHGSTLEIKITFRETGKKFDIRKQTETISFNIASLEWQEKSAEINIPPKASICSIFVNANLKDATPVMLKQPSLQPL